MSSNNVEEKASALRLKFQYTRSLVDGSPRVDVSTLATAIIDASERFNLWAGSLEPQRNPGLSVSGVQQYTCRQLDDIFGALHEGMDLRVSNRDEIPTRLPRYIVTDILAVGPILEDLSNLESSHESDAISEPTFANDADRIIAVISDSLGYLFRARKLVQTPVSRPSRFDQAMQASPHRFLLDTDVTLIKNTYPKLRNDRFLARRLALATAKRKQFISFCEQNRRTTAEGFLDARIDVDFSSSNLSMSDSERALLFQHVPKLSSLSPNGQPFECPVCYTTLNCKLEKQWL